MKVLVSGSTGLVGAELCKQLTAAGHTVAALRRSHPVYGEDILWDPAAGEIEAERLEGFDAVIHLAGENIAGKRWSAAFKDEIRDSRVKGTKLLADALASIDNPPKTLLCASAIGYYGDRGDEVMTETSSPGGDFLADVCREWESAADPAREKGLRVAHLRIGVVLSSRGGALQKMLLPFKLGGGGIVGDGKQYWSWVNLDDVVGAFIHCLNDESLSGPINCVSPNPATNHEFTKALGNVLNRPTFLPVPGFAAKLAFGEMAEALMLASTRVVPKKLQQSGYEFQYPDIEAALERASTDKPA